MNKLLIFPLFFLLALSLYSVADATGTFDGESGESPDLPDDVTVDIPEADTQEFDIWEGTYTIAIIIAANTNNPNTAKPNGSNTFLFLLIMVCLLF